MKERKMEGKNGQISLKNISKTCKIFRTFSIFRKTPGSHICFVWLTNILKIKKSIHFP